MDGYTRLSALMEQQSDLKIIRRFQNLRTIRLVHLSAEIQHLQDELAILVEADRQSNDPEKQSIESHYASMVEAGVDRTGLQQVQLWNILSVKLKEHGDLTLQSRALSHLPPANRTSFRHLDDWLHDRQGGHGFLQGAEADIWSAAWLSDMTSLTAAKPNDAVSRLISSVITPLYHKILGHRHVKHVYITDPYTGEGKLEMPLHDYPDSSISTVIDVLSTLLASLLPGLSSLALYFVKDMKDRMAVIVAMTFLFSGTLTCLTGARRVDVFVATSAFAAVLVVFVGNDCPESKSCAS